MKSNLFPIKHLDSVLKTIDADSFARHTSLQDIKQIISAWASMIEKGVLDKENEISLQDSFLSEIFGKVLGYKFIHESPNDPDEEWNLSRERKTKADSTRSDAALGFFSSRKKNDIVRVIIELKKSKTDLDAKQKRQGLNSPVEQAFSYSYKFSKKCKWIIVSNFNEIRLYNRSASINEYEVFFIEKLKDESELKKFLYLLSKGNLIEKTKDSIIDSFYKSIETEQEVITKEFYNEYKELRLYIYKHLKDKNSSYDDLLLLEKTQKLLDRFIFICYCSCKNLQLLPENIFPRMVAFAEDPINFADISLWKYVLNLFKAIDKGSLHHNISKFNGGLFDFDEILDKKLQISGEIVKSFEKIAAKYDFDSDINVNILGHIFEQSITDIEELKASIAGKNFDKKKGKRKKDGIYYTPEYISRYIVEQAVGTWLEDRKKELGFEELPEILPEEADSSNKKKNGKAYKQALQVHREFWRQYREKLADIKILDPACGSGAFLNQAFDYLYKEGQNVNKELAKLEQGYYDIFGLDKHILQNNLFGVDFNHESVEISKLSLWLKTANKGSELTSLDENIKCGNSLIDDPEIAGQKAFKWEEEFPEIMENGGFDVVVGNPPWGAKLLGKEIKYLTNKYRTVLSGEVDSYIIFMLIFFNLMKQEGLTGLIVPDTWLTVKRCLGLRKYIYKNLTIQDIYDRYKPFEDAKDTRSHTVIFKNSLDLECTFGVRVSDAKQNIIKRYHLDSSILKNVSEWNLYVSPDEFKIFRKMEKCSDRLGRLYNLKYGLRTGKNSEYLTDIDVNHLNYKIARGSHIERYFFNWKKEYLKETEGLPISYFDEECLKKKIIIQRIRTNSTDINSRWLESAYIEEDNFLPLDSTSFIYKKCESSLKYLLAVISSYLMDYYYKAHYTDVNVKPIYLEKLPIPKLSVTEQKPFIEKADTILTNTGELHELKTKFLNFLKSELNPAKISKKLENWQELDWEDFKKEMKKCKVRELNIKERNEWLEYFTEQKQKASEIQSIIDKTDKEIDRMVYKLYGLSQQEIETVENLLK